MANPNLLSLSAIYGLNSGVNVTSTSPTTILNNPSSSGKLLKVNHVRVTNNSTTSVATFSVTFTETSGSVNIASNMSVSVGGSIVVVDKESYVYLDENSSLSITSSDTTPIGIFVSYEELS